MSGQPLFEARHIVKDFQIGGGLLAKSRIVHAVDDVSFSIKKGETLGLVGESGCGKSVFINTILKLLPKNATVKSGEIFFKGKRQQCYAVNNLT